MSEGRTRGVPLGDVGAVASDPRLAAWVDAMLATPGLTAIRDRGDAFRQHVVDSLAAVPVLAAADGAIVDVGSGGGAPGLPLAAAFPDREADAARGRRPQVRLPAPVAASRSRTCRVVHGRAEEQPVDAWGAAVAKALAAPPVALEWCLRAGAPGRSGGALHGSRRRSHRARAPCRTGVGGGDVRAVPADGSRALLVRPSSSRRRRASRGARARPGNVLSPEYLVPRGRHGLRAREPEGRRRQDDDGREPRRLPRRGR